MLVGRETELSAIGGLLDAALGGRGFLAMLIGEPGIGKTRLADAVTIEAERRGFRVGWGRAWESGGAPAYFPWTEALSALGLRTPDASLTTAVESEVARFQLFRAVADELRSKSAPTPVLIVLDDLHVADISSLRMLQFVARELRSMRVAIVATRRDAEASMTPEVESTLARTMREGQSFVLTRLLREDVARLVRDEAPRLPAELDTEIWRATQGNPLFVGEVVRLLEADMGLAHSIPIPHGAREILHQRLARLDRKALDVLEVAAVSGIESQQAVIVAASGESEAVVTDAVAAAIRSGLLASSGDGRIRFSHALVRDALYREIPRARRSTLHGAIAAALERSSAPPLSEIVHHAIEAGPHASLVGRTSRAALALGAAYADEDAIVLLERSLGVVQGDGHATAELAILLGRTRMRIGDVTGGRASCVRAVEIARELGDGALFARAALMHAAEVTQGETDTATHRLLEEALDRLPASDAGLRVRLQARLAASLQPASRPAEVAGLALDAVTEARALGDETALLDVLHNAGAAFGEAFFVPEVVDMARDAVRLAERLGDRTKLLRARLRLVFALMEIGDIAGADANITTLESEARATGQPRHIWPVPLLRGMRALQEGRFEDADAIAEEMRELGASIPAARASMLMHRFARLRAQERVPELLEIEPQILAITARWNDAEMYESLVISGIRSIAGDLETARRHLARIPLDSTPGRVRIALGMLAAATISVGEKTHAAALYERLVPDADRWHMFMFGGFVAEATYARYLGGLARLTGRYAEAERHFEAALARAEAASARPECARVLAAYGALLLERGDEQRGHELLARARPIARELGLARVLASIDSSGAPLGQSTRSAPPSMPASSTTPRDDRTTKRPADERPVARSIKLTQEGETWLITLGPTSIRLKDSRGLAYIARLVAAPGRDVHVLDMAGTGEPVDAGDAGDALDPEARAAYKRRLAELDEELREAESWNDGARVTRARSEMEMLSAELASAVGIGGRSRRVGSAAERARVAVTRRVRDVIRRVTEHSPELGRHLEATVKTGMLCSYRPI